MPTLVVKFEMPDDFKCVKEVRYLLMDALYEFAAHRTPENEYVAKRYPKGYCGDHKRDNEKLIEVIKRVKTAREMHSNISIIELYYS